MNRPGQRPSRQPLSPTEILELDRVLIDVFQTIRGLREQNPVAKLIKYPSVPSLLSESLVVAATPTLFGPSWIGRYGGHVADVVIQNTETGATGNVEVKATGQHAFQELKRKDLGADWLVWVRFGQRYERGEGPIEVAVLEAPGTYISEPSRLDVRRFEMIPGVSRSQRLLRFGTLEAMLPTEARAAGALEGGERVSLPACDSAEA
jgi:hypothetical protein